MERRPYRFKCNLCHFSAFTESKLLLHYVRTHRFDPRFTVTCAREGCRATYRNWASYKKHLQRKHRGAVEEHEEFVQDDDDAGDPLQMENPGENAAGKITLFVFGSFFI